MNLSTKNYRAEDGFYDKHDEVEAYRRQALLDGSNSYTKNTLPLIYQRLPSGPIDIKNAMYFMHNINNPIILQKIADKGFVFRVNGVTYMPK